ncbi:MAG: dihydrofolate reductase, partial [Muribaculaceae bacterium]|nr:dihydrofolate reductase [Muribaculaceae bacterium]
MSKNLSIVVAVARNLAIGNGGDLLCHLSADLKHFKAVTMGGTVIMGRRTWQSLPKGALPGRRNIVITRDAAFDAPGAEVATSLDAAISLAETDDRKVFIIGGGKLYAST